MFDPYDHYAACWVTLMNKIYESNGKGNIRNH